MKVSILESIINVGYPKDLAVIPHCLNGIVFENDLVVRRKHAENICSGILVSDCEGTRIIPNS